MEGGLGITDTGGERDGGADVALFAQCTLKVDPGPFVFEFYFHGHGVESAQFAIARAVNLGGAPKKLGIFHQAHCVGDDPDALGGHRHISTGPRDGRVPDADV